MLMTHTKDFAETLPVPARPPLPGPAPHRPRCHFVSGTLLETPQGWRPVDSLRPGDRVATLDGGFAALTGHCRHAGHAGPAQHWHVPAGALDNCSDLHLDAGQRVAVMAPECETLFGVPCVLLPVPAMTGFRGIRSTRVFGQAARFELAFATEEIVYAQTGALLHVPPTGDAAAPAPFFRTLSYGETRALLSLMNRGHCGFDRHGFAPAYAA